MGNAYRDEFRDRISGAGQVVERAWVGCRQNLEFQEVVEKDWRGVRTVGELSAGCDETCHLTGLTVEEISLQTRDKAWLDNRP